MSEQEIVRSILSALAYRPDVFAWRQNTGAFRTEHKGKSRFLRFGIPGQADITGILASGTRLELEVKQPGSRQREEQRVFGERIERMGGVYAVVHSIDEALAAVERGIR